jgi:hypothetical protein
VRDVRVAAGVTKASYPTGPTHGQLREIPQLCYACGMGASFQSWKRDLDKLKAAAIAQTYEDPKPTDAAKAIMAEGTRKPLATWMPAVRDAVRAGVDLGIAPAPACTIYGWRVLLTRARVADGQYLWQLSASLSPRDRKATDRDWQMLGKFAAHVGAPQDPFYVPEDARDAHHWQWTESTAS